MLNKPLAEVTEADLRQAIADEVPEGQQYEFKSALSAKGGRDAWHDGADSYGVRARDEILEAVVAFANAYGGIVMIGVTESSDPPTRAAGLAPVPRCAELARRLRQQCQTCIEPEIPSIEAVGVPVGEDGSGVVVIRVGRSRRAPHRHMPSKECYVRRADESRPMTMREIQDLTLNVERGLARVDAVLAERRQISDANNRFPGMKTRVTLAPIDPIYVDRVHSNGAVRPTVHAFHARFSEGDGRAEISFPVHSWDERPVLRGTEIQFGSGGVWNGHIRASCDGLIEYYLDLNRSTNEQPFQFFPAWLMAMVANALCSAERFRTAADAPSAEYAMDIDFRVTPSTVPVMRYGSAAWGELGQFPVGTTRFPRYAVGARDTFQRIAALVERDLWHTIGKDFPSSLLIEFDEAFGALGISTSAP